MCVCKLLCVYNDDCKESICVDDWEFTIEALEKNTNMSPLKFDEIWFVSSRKEIQKMITMKWFTMTMKLVKLIIKMTIDYQLLYKMVTSKRSRAFGFLILLMTDSWWSVFGSRLQCSLLNPWYWPLINSFERVLHCL